MNRFTKITLITGVILTFYGYLCRAAGLYFFWESKYFGWAIILIGFVGFLRNRIKLKKAQGRRSLLEKIGIGILIFVLLVQAILIIVLPLTDAYKVSKEFLLNNEVLKKDIGNIKSFSLIPLGSIQESSGGNGKSGTATILLTVKGEKKFRDVTVNVEKTPGTEWKVIGAE